MNSLPEDILSIVQVTKQIFLLYKGVSYMKFIPLLLVINYKLHIALNKFETTYFKMINFWVHLDFKKKTLNKNAHYF